VFFSTLAFAFIEPFFFIGYLISIAVFGLYQAIFMANAGGAWDNAKKVVEVDLKMKGTPLHDATVVGDTVGDPFKDTAGPALNPMIKVVNLVSVIIAPIIVQYASPGLPVAVKISVWAIAVVLLGVLTWAVIRSKAPAPSMTPVAVTRAPALAANPTPAVRKSGGGKNKRK
jgi:K(+)-stimulated pyrophosphate-energized sodium pump